MKELVIPVGDRRVAGCIHCTPHAQATVVFVHGSGIDRHERRNRFVAHKLARAGFDTLLLDLLERDEALDRYHVFDIDLQAARLTGAIEQLREDGVLRLPLGYFASGVGAGVALLAAARRPADVRAIVVRGGRPDTALYSLPVVQAPTLFIVDPSDHWHEDALARMKADKALAVVPSKSHAFREPAALGAVAEHALRWYSRHLAASSEHPSGAARAG